MNVTDFVPILLVVLFVVSVLKTVKAVPQGMEYTVEQFGKYVRTLKPGSRCGCLYPGGRCAHGGL